MKNKLTHNWGLKLVSIVFAFFLWIIVTNMDDPVVQWRIYNVPVTLTNTDVITSQGKTYEVLNDTDEIGIVTVTAARSVIDSLDDDDIVAIADFNNLTLQNTVEVQLSTKKYSTNLESISGSTDEIELEIENLKTKTLALSASTTGEVSDGYMIGDITPSQNQVRISGPESVISQVASAQVQISVTGFTQDIVTDADIELLDADGNPVDAEKINSNITTVEVEVQLLQTKTIGLNFESMGTPAEGYSATGEITYSPTEITVAGTEAALKKVSSIDISADALNITGATGDLTAVININKYLPSGLTLADTSFGGNVTATVKIEKNIEKKFTLAAADISFDNIPEGYKAEVVDPEESYDVTFAGLRKVLNDTQAEDITATADLEEILDQESVGENLYHTTLQFTNSKGAVEVSSPVQVWIKLTEE